MNFVFFLSFSILGLQVGGSFGGFFDIKTFDKKKIKEIWAANQIAKGEYQASDHEILCNDFSKERRNIFNHSSNMLNIIIPYFNYPYFSLNACYFYLNEDCHYKDKISDLELSCAVNLAQHLIGPQLVFLWNDKVKFLFSGLGVYGKSTIENSKNAIHNIAFTMGVDCFLNKNWSISATMFFFIRSVFDAEEKIENLYFFGDKKNYCMPRVRGFVGVKYTFDKKKKNSKKIGKIGKI